MTIPQCLADCSPDLTRDCARIPESFSSSLGLWRKSVVLVGVPVPRRLVKVRPPAILAHAVTGNIDVIVNPAAPANAGAYRTPEENPICMGIRRAKNDKGAKVNWRWKTTTGHGVTVNFRLLADGHALMGGALQEIADTRTDLGDGHPSRFPRFRCA
jgi:hypothetical protein